ncbi:MAG: sensor histidine kinase [Deltaproteobacteria bacterium]|nr:sensor histidine kinase [Deltaproteobacteria bacterium]
MLFVLAGCQPVIQGENSRDGKLDLGANDDLRSAKVLRLDGKWLFRWQELLEPASFQNTPIAPMFEIEVPSIWNGQFSDGDETGLSGEGFATYALELYLPDEPPGASWGVLIEEVSSAYSLYAVTKDNVYPLSSNGRLGKTPSEHIPQWAPRISELPTLAGEKVWLVLHVSNFSYARGGVWKPLYIGTYDGLTRDLMVRRLVSAGLLGLLLVMALYHLARFLMRSSDLGSAWFTLLCVLVFIREFSVSRMIDFYSYVPTDEIFSILIRFEFLSFQMAGPAVMSFVGTVFPGVVYRRLTRLAWLVSTPYFIISIFGTTEAMSVVLRSYYPIIGLQVLTICIYLSYCVAKGRSFAWVALFGCAAMGVGAVNDMLFTQSYSSSEFWSTYSFAVFVLVESYLLAAQSTWSFQQVDKSRKDNLEKIKAQFESARLEKQLNGALKTKIHIFSNVAHELNNPLNYVSLGADGTQQSVRDVKSILDNLLGDAKNSPEAKQVVDQIEDHFDSIGKNLDIISSGSQVAANVVTEMRGLAEIDGAIREALAVGDLIDGAMRRVRADQQPEILEKMHFEESLGDLTTVVEGNPYMLIHAMSHVLINAVRFCTLATESPTVWLSGKSSASSWILSIQNNGPPISASAIESLLEPGALAEVGRNLPVARELLREQGASLRLADAGHITGRVIFEIELPLSGQGPATVAVSPA